MISAKSKEKRLKMNDLEQRAQKHRRKSKGLFTTLNPDAGNVEHNVAMFNHMNSPQGGPCTNPSGPAADGDMCEELIEAATPETVELQYSDLEIEVCTQPAKLPSYQFEYDRDEAQFTTEKVSYELEVPKDEIVVFIVENMDPEDYSGDWDNDSTEEIETFVRNNFESLFTKYERAILNSYRDTAVKKAETEHNYFNESFEGTDNEYVIMAITHEGTRQYYNVSSVPHWVDKAQDATIFDDQDEARGVWFKLDMKPFKRVVVPVYDPDVMNEDFYTPIPAPFEEKIRNLSYYDRVCLLMDKLQKQHLEVTNIGSPTRIRFEVKQLRGNASVKLRFLEIDTLPGFTFVVDGKHLDPITCETEEGAITKIVELAKQAHFKTFDIQVEELNQKYKLGQKVLYHGKPSKIFGVEYSEKYGYDLLIENPDFDPYIYTGNDAWKYKRIWVGEDVELVEETLTEADYGGAFDVDPEQYFTRDDLNEFADEVIYEVSQATAVVLSVADLSISKNNITLELEGADSYSCSHTFTVNMRKIRQPKDLMKYVDPVAKVFTSDWMKYLDDCTPIEEAAQLTTCPDCGSEKFNDTNGLCIDCGYDEKSHGDTGTDDYDDDYDDDYEDTSSFTFEGMKLHEQLYTGKKK